MEITHEINNLQLKLLILQQKYEQIRDIIAILKEMISTLQTAEIILNPQNYTDHIQHTQNIAYELIKLINEITMSIVDNAGPTTSTRS